MKHLAAIEIPGRPWTMNQAIRQPWYETHKHTKAVREQAFLLWRAALGPAKKGKHLPGLLKVKVQVRTQDAKVQDIGAAMPAVKAAIDGLVDTGWIPDDTPKWIHELSFVAVPPHRMVTDMLIQIWGPDC